MGVEHASERRSPVEDIANSALDKVESIFRRVLDKAAPKGSQIRQLIDTNLEHMSAIFPAPIHKFSALRDLTEFPIEEFVEAEYDKSLTALTDGDLYDKENEESEEFKFPTKAEIFARLQQLTPEQKEVVRGMSHPMLVIAPEGVSSQVFVESLNTGARGKNDTLLSLSRIKQFENQDKALGIYEGSEKLTGWKIAIAEGSSELTTKPGILQDLITEWKAGEKAQKGAVLIDHTVDALIQKRSLIEKRPIDRKNWAVLSRRDNNNEFICEDGKISGGGYSDWYDCVVFGLEDPCDHFTNPCFRYMVIAPKQP